MRGAPNKLDGGSSCSHLSSISSTARAVSSDSHCGRVTILRRIQNSQDATFHVAKDLWLGSSIRPRANSEVPNSHTLKQRCSNIKKWCCKRQSWLDTRITSKRPVLRRHSIQQHLSPAVKELEIPRGPTNSRQECSRQEPKQGDLRCVKDKRVTVDCTSDRLNWSDWQASADHPTILETWKSVKHNPHKSLI